MPPKVVGKAISTGKLLILFQKYKSKLEIIYINIPVS